MYLPPHFEESQPDVLHELVRKNPFGTLVVATKDGFDVNHLPFLLDETAAPAGVLHGHVSRANPVWQTANIGVEAVAIFQGANGYITPFWYPTKQETSRVVPTWNYAVAHAYGHLRFIEDAEWLGAFVRRLTSHFEASRAQPWKVDDAPSAYIESLLGQIVGIEMPISLLVGKYKLSQNQPERNRQGVVEGLLNETEPAALDLAHTMQSREKAEPK